MILCISKPLDGIPETINIAPPIYAQMAELVDAADSKSAVRKDVQVRFLFWAQTPQLRGFLYNNLPL